MPNYIGNDKSYELLDGQYGIFYYLLTTNYTSRNMSEYESLKREQLRFWQNIHDQYPYLILEDNYSYSLATTSAELMQMAKLIFKGKVQPERNYSLTIIDVASLENYKGQELLPGQGISLDAYRYYQSDDDVYRALSQYLFISDVSYSLRDDSSIQLTVDSMKYQEKLLQSLVSLIK